MLYFKLLYTMICLMALSDYIESLYCPDKCACFGVDLIVDCRHKNLTQLPRNIPRQTKELRMDSNMLHELTKAPVENLQELVTLGLSNNNKLMQVQPGFFDSLTGLQNLDISNTSLKKMDIQKHVICGLNNTKINRLEMATLNLKTIPDFFFECLGDKNLTVLNLNKNALNNLSSNVFEGLNYVQELNIGTNDFTYLNPYAFKLLKHLKWLILVYSSVKNLSQLCDIPVLRNLEHLDLSQNNLNNINDISCMNRLRILDIDYNNFHVIGSQTFSFLWHSLTILSIHGNNVHSFEEGAFNSTLLENLDISGNGYKFGYKDKDLLKYVPNLMKLNLGKNEILQGFGQDIFLLMMKYVPKLTSLTMQEMYISSLPRNAFSNFVHLQILNLDDNKLTQLPEYSFSGLVNLSHFGASSNQISSIQKKDLPKSVLSTLTLLNLAQNPWACDCRLRWFRNFIDKSKIKFSAINTRWVCSSPHSEKGVSILNFHPLFEDCYTARNDYILYALCCIAIATVVLSAFLSLVYHYRWDIRYFTYMTYMKQRKIENVMENSNATFEYDAFVSYHHNEYFWISNVFIPKLEEEFNLKCCVHDRDWLLGADIFDNIEESITASRKIIFVVTNAFATSNWCQQELSIAQTHCLEMDIDKIVLVFLEDVLQSNLTPRLVYQMKTRMYVEWTENIKGQALFWEKLKRSIEKPLQSVTYD